MHEQAKYIYRLATIDITQPRQRRAPDDDAQEEKSANEAHHVVGGAVEI